MDVAKPEGASGRGTVAMRKALVVGINHYDRVGALYGCVDDAYKVKAVLERHGDGTVNFGVELLTGTGPSDRVLRADLRQRIEELFNGPSDTALFYFSGHGHIEATGGYLLASDSVSNDGIALSDLLTLANRSTASNRVIMLDSCHAGVAGARPLDTQTTEIREGVSILTASTADQYAMETSEGGVFTELMVDALSGAAGNLVGDVTPGSVYAHIDQSLGPWKQRPIFKTNVKNFVSLRKVHPPIPLADLQQLPTLFPEAGYDFKLDPTFEPERQGNQEGVPPPDPLNTVRFAALQRLNRVNLVVPVDAPHMWHAAMQSKSCKLTVLGEHYRKLAVDNLI